VPDVEYTPHESLHSVSISESETTSGWNWKVLRLKRRRKTEGEARTGIKSLSLWRDFLALKGLIISSEKFDVFILWWRHYENHDNVIIFSALAVWSGSAVV